MMETGDRVLLTTQLLHEMPLHSTTCKRFYRHNHLDIKGSVWHLILHSFYAIKSPAARVSWTKKSVYLLNMHIDNKFQTFLFSVR